MSHRPLWYGGAVPPPLTATFPAGVYLQARITPPRPVGVIKKPLTCNLQLTSRQHPIGPNLAVEDCADSHLPPIPRERYTRHTCRLGVRVRECERACACARVRVCVHMCMRTCVSVLHVRACICVGSRRVCAKHETSQQIAILAPKTNSNWRSKFGDRVGRRDRSLGWEIRGSSWQAGSKSGWWEIRIKLDQPPRPGSGHSATAHPTLLVAAYTRSRLARQ
jgi:hypothetical protein